MNYTDHRTRVFIKAFTLFVIYIIPMYVASATTYALKTEKDGTQWRIIEKYGSYGAENEKGKVIIPAQFKDVYYDNGTFTVKDNCGHLGKYTRNGKVIFPPHKIYSNLLY